MDSVLLLFEKYGVAAMIILIFFEYACFPVSSEIVLPFTGALARSEGMSFFLLLPLSVLAGLLGTSLCYLIGYVGGDALLSKIIKKFPKAEHGLFASRKKFTKYGAGAVCIGRVIPLCRTYIAFIAGAAKQRPSVFFPYSLLGITIWNCALISIGYFLQDNFTKVSLYYSKYKLFIIPVLLLFFLLLFLRHQKKKRSIAS